MKAPGAVVMGVSTVLMLAGVLLVVTGVALPLGYVLMAAGLVGSAVVPVVLLLRAARGDGRPTNR